MANQEKSTFKLKKSLTRRIVLGIIFLALCLGIVFKTGIGTLSSFGVEDVAAICPVGILESILASRFVVSREIIALIVVVISTLILGKFFCAWVCPIPSLQEMVDSFNERRESKEGFFKSTRKKKNSSNKSTDVELINYEILSQRKCNQAKSCQICNPKTSRKSIDSRHFVLGGALLSAGIFGFPVFCLICPIGLTFATIVVVVQLFGSQIVSWGLLLFPALLLIELTLLRKWCIKFCPISATLSLLSKPNRFFRPNVDEEKCLHSKGVECQICSDVCPEKLNPHSDKAMQECSKCLNCSINCPVQAISFPVYKKKNKNTTNIKKTVNE